MSESDTSHENLRSNQLFDEKIGNSAQIPYLTARYFYSGNYSVYF